MALKKRINKFGYEFEYNMIDHMNYSKEDDSTIITIELFKSKAARDADIHNYADLIEFKAHGNMTVEQAYNFLKTTPFYHDAEDC